MRRLAISLVALALLCLPAGAEASLSFRPGAEGFSAAALAEGEVPETQAGAHPTALKLAVAFDASGRYAEGDLRELAVELPPGLIEDPGAVPDCSQADFHTRRSSRFEASLSGEDCPDRTQVGIATLTSSYGGGETRSFGIFNLAPPPGAPSEIGLNPYGAPLVFVPRVRQAEGSYGITLRAAEIPQLISLESLDLTIWGTPWSLLHDAQRGDCLNEEEPTFGRSKCSVGPPKTNPPAAYLTMPTACEGPLPFTAAASSWQGGSVSRQAWAPAMAGCGSLTFDPKPAGRLSASRAASPSGYEFEIAQETAGITEPDRLAPSAVRKAVVQLPEGVTIDPSVGAGLGVCTPAQYDAETAASLPGQGCPSTAKIGDFTVKTPLFGETIAGAIFLAAPHDNPFGSLIAVYLVAKAPGHGILVKVAGELRQDPATGRLTATFDRLPQLPYSSLLVHFREGQRSPLASPRACGTFYTATDLSAWGDASLTRHFESPADVAAGVGGGPCPSALAPFAPTALAGSVNSQAGAYSPFYLHLRRTDLEQEITHYSAQLPPGLLGKIANVPFCPDAAIEAARGRSGTAELQRPDCPAASLIGHTYSGYGVGSVLAYAPGNLYLAGPYHGAPLSIVAVDSALVGPFDLGVVIVRSAVDVDPLTARISIDSQGSDPIPHIIDGIPIYLRDVRVYVDRGDFTVNPTSCDRFRMTSTLNGSGARFSDPADDTTATATYNYQAFDCAALGFDPQVAVALRIVKQHRRRPALKVIVTPRAKDANIAAAQVTLPPTLFLDQANLKTICTGAQFAREECPQDSVYGHVKVWTPLLEAPLEGPAYLRSSANLLPDLVFDLHGRGVHIVLAGRIDSKGGGLRGSFANLPDAPVSRFALTMRGGPHGLLEAVHGICSASDRGLALFAAHDNAVERARPQATLRCPRRHRKRHAKHKRHVRHKRRGSGR